MNLPTSIQKIDNQILDEKNISLFVKRDDLIHPVISGNKWRKLKYNIEKFRQGRYEKLLTFGGAFSNHIAATARAGKEFGIPTIGIIRGDELNQDSNSTLKQAAGDGMQLIFTSREEYDLKDEKYYQEELRRRHGHIWIVPEGGSNYYGMLGCQEIMNEVDVEFDSIWVACGTGTTAAGLLLGGAKVTAVAVLKGGAFLEENVRQLLSELLPKEEVSERLSNLDLITEYHFGGYARYDQKLMDFISDFEENNEILLDQVYTGKMMYALFDLVHKNYFPPGSSILALHTGGIQGKILIS